MKHILNTIVTTNIFELKDNTFKKNKAEICGGVLYLPQIIPNVDFIQNNIYDENSATYGNNFCTYPIRLVLSEKNIERNEENSSEYSFYNIIPAITSLELSFYLTDYFQHKTIDFNQG